MLVLTPKKDDVILIGDKIKLTIACVNNGQIRIVFDVDKSIPIVRVNNPKKNKAKVPLIIYDK